MVIYTPMIPNGAAGPFGRSSGPAFIPIDFFQLPAAILRSACVYIDAGAENARQKPKETQKEKECFQNDDQDK